jgi:chemotaxis protein histidine kinase CheA
LSETPPESPYTGSSTPGLSPIGHVDHSVSTPPYHNTSTMMSPPGMGGHSNIGLDSTMMSPPGMGGHSNIGVDSTMMSPPGMVGGDSMTSPPGTPDCTKKNLLSELNISAEETAAAEKQAALEQAALEQAAADAARLEAKEQAAAEEAQREAEEKAAAEKARLEAEKQAAADALAAAEAARLEAEAKTAADERARLEAETKAAQEQAAAAEAARLEAEKQAAADALAAAEAARLEAEEQAAAAARLEAEKAAEEAQRKTEAATTIQAVFRGMKTRKELKATAEQDQREAEEQAAAEKAAQEQAAAEEKAAKKLAREIQLIPATQLIGKLEQFISDGNNITLASKIAAYDLANQIKDNFKLISSDTDLLVAAVDFLDQTTLLSKEMIHFFVMQTKQPFTANNDNWPTHLSIKLYEKNNATESIDINNEHPLLQALLHNNAIDFTLENRKPGNSKTSYNLLTHDIFKRYQGKTSWESIPVIGSIIKIIKSILEFILDKKFSCTFQCPKIMPQTISVIAQQQPCASRKQEPEPETEQGQGQGKAQVPVLPNSC